MRRLALAALGVAAALSFGTPQATAADEGSLYVTAGTVHTGTGETFRPGAVSIVDGRIQAVGSPADVSAPAGAKRVEAGDGAVIIPGLVAAWSQHVSPLRAQLHLYREIALLCHCLRTLRNLFFQ